MASWISIGKRALGAAALVCTLLPPVLAEGVSAYLPLNLEPEIERQIERVLILADEPVLKRPIPVELVKLALPQACKVDKPLCTKVGRYLERYSRDYALTHASATAAYTHAKGREADYEVVPNEYGQPIKSNWDLSAQAYVQPSDYLLATGGGVAYEGRTNPTGTALSFGFSWAQFDVGYEPHWFSPATGSSMLMSTDAPVNPSATLSNWEPLTRLGFQYELFWTRLQQTSSDGGRSVPGDNILYNDVASRGNPNLLGMEFSIEPFPGWSLGVNRLLEYGGGSGLPSSAHFVLHDFFKPNGANQNESNTQASYVSRFIFPGKTPFSVYFQYAGEDNSDGGSYLLGNAALTAGIDFPRIWRHFDMTYEVAEWQNIWYVHNIFLDGMTNYGLSLGAWGADQRNFGDGVGARSQMLRIGWEPPFGGYLEERVRTLANQPYFGGDSRTYKAANPGAYPYHHFVDFTMTYSRPWNGLTVGGEATVGRDIYGDSFSRLAGFVRYGGDSRTRDDGALDEDSYAGGPNEHGAEMFVDVGGNATQVKINTEPNLPQTTSSGIGPHLGLGARRAVSEKNDLGVRAEFDEVDGHELIGARLVDFRHRWNTSFASSLYLGVDRYNVATPAYSMYFGTGIAWRDFMPHWLPKWDLDFDLRHAQNIARDHVLATDVQGSRPETFYKMETAALYLSRRF